MLRLCQTAKAQPCGEVKLKLEAIGTFWMAPSCSQKVFWAPGWVRIAECYQCYQYLRCKHSDIQIMEFTNWHGHSPVKDPSNAPKRKCERKTESPFFHLPRSNHGTVCTESTDTVAAQMGGCSGLAGFAWLAIALIVLSHKVVGQVSPRYHMSLLLEVLLQKAYPAARRGPKASTSWLLVSDVGQNVPCGETTLAYHKLSLLWQFNVSARITLYNLK